MGGYYAASVSEPEGSSPGAEAPRSGIPYVTADPIYLQPAQFEDPPPPFRTGAAGHMWLGEDGDFELDTRVQISANSVHALLGHRVVEALNRLPLMGELGIGLDVVIPQSALLDASHVLYDADRKTYGGVWEFDVGVDDVGRCCRVRIDNREYQRGLLRLTDLFHSASRVGHAVWIRI